MLYELIYRSTAKPGLTESDIKDILSKAHAFNKKNNITGCLLYNKGQFLQLLEGDFTVLLELYDRIKRDSRHYDFLLMHMKETQYRTYSNWTMAYKSLEKKDLNKYTGVSQFTELESNEKKSSISKILFQAIGNDLFSYK